jgi:hypothetical protein
MDYDTDKMDEYTLALLYLVTHERQEGMEARAWKGFDWDTMNRLYDKGYISNPVGKAKSVISSRPGIGPLLFQFLPVPPAAEMPR